MQQTALKWVIVGLLIVFTSGLVLLAIGVIEFQSSMLKILAWVQNSTWVGLVVMSLLLVVSVTLMLPSVMLTVGAGFLFGVWAGSLLVVTSETIGATLAFAIARFGAPQKLRNYLINLKYYTAIDGVVARRGWRLVAATRMIPFFPFKLSNYVFGVSSVSGPHYVVGTFLGLWPITIFNVYLGSMAVDILSIGTANALTRQSWYWSILMLIVLLLSIAVLVKKQKEAYLKWTDDK